MLSDLEKIKACLSDVLSNNVVLHFYSLSTSESKEKEAQIEHPLKLVVSTVMHNYVKYII